MKICKYCEKENETGSQLCWFCGGDLSGAQTVDKPRAKPGSVNVGQSRAAPCPKPQTKPSRDFVQYAKRLFDFRGRAGRGEFLLIYFSQVAVWFGTIFFLGLLEAALDLPYYALLDPIATVMSLVFIPISLAALVRRFHDLGHSGWFVLLLIIPIVAPIILLYLIFKAGQLTNKYST